MAEHSDLIERLRAACVGHPSASITWPHRILHEAADALSSQSLSLSEAREENDRKDAEIERLKGLVAGIREFPHEPPGVAIVRLAVAKAICLAMGDDWEREGPGDVLMEAYGPLADAALSARSALENGPAGLADATKDPTESDLSSLRKGADVAVKPLEWVVGTWHGTVVFKAKSIVGEYMVAPKAWGSGWLWRLDLHWDDTYYSVSDEDEGKAAAQSDYETRIRSALVSGSREEQ